jgi:hypothetical protein
MLNPFRFESGSNQRGKRRPNLKRVNGKRGIRRTQEFSRRGGQELSPHGAGDGSLEPRGAND